MIILMNEWCSWSYNIWSIWLDFSGFSAGQSVRPSLRGCSSYSFAAQGARCFTLEELGQAANYFNALNFIGAGKFGDVYKGLLNDTIVAIKRRPAAPSQEFIQEVTIHAHQWDEFHVGFILWSIQTWLMRLLAMICRHHLIWSRRWGSSMRNPLFMMQVEYLSSVRHRNLVSLLGYCQENGLQMLVYEYVPNGSISTHLYGKFSPSLTSFSLWTSCLRLSMVFFFFFPPIFRCKSNIQWAAGIQAQAFHCAWSSQRYGWGRFHASFFHPGYMKYLLKKWSLGRACSCWSHCNTCTLSRVPKKKKKGKAQEVPLTSDLELHMRHLNHGLTDPEDLPLFWAV